MKYTSIYVRMDTKNYNVNSCNYKRRKIYKLANISFNIYTSAIKMDFEYL